MKKYMLTELRKVLNLTLTAIILFCSNTAFAQTYMDSYHWGRYGAPEFDKSVSTRWAEKQSLGAKINAARERLKNQQGAYANYLKSSGENWKEMPYYKLTPAQTKEHLTLTAEIMGELLKGSSEYKEYQVGRWLKYGTIFTLFAIVTWGTCAWLAPYFAEAGYTVGAIAGIGFPAVCSVEKIGASVIWTLLLSGSVIVLTDVLKNTYDIFSKRLYGQTYEEYLEGLKDKAVGPQAAAEDMAHRFEGKEIPTDWENENLHKQYLKLLYAFEAIAQELLGDNPNRYEMAWLDIMALASGYDLPEDRTKLEAFVKKKNYEYKEEINKQINKKIEWYKKFPGKYGVPHPEDAPLFMK